MDCRTSYQETWSCWIAGRTGLHACYLEELSHRIARCFFWERRLPNIVLEAMADFNLWVWHAAFGFAGGLNDLNIWENSLLLDDMVSGAFSHLKLEDAFWLMVFIQKFCVLLDPFPSPQVGMRNVILAGKRLHAKKLNVHLVSFSTSFKLSLIQLKNGMSRESSRLFMHASCCTTWWSKNKLIMTKI